MSRGEDGLEHGWDRADESEWAKVPEPRTARSFRPEDITEPELPAIRVWVVVVCVALIASGVAVAVAYRIPGTVNGADLLGLILVVTGVLRIVREVRR